MRLVHTTATSVVIWFAGEEAPSRREIPALVRGALRGAGLPPWPRVRAECFLAAGETLLVARPAPPRRFPGRRRPVRPPRPEGDPPFRQE